MLSQGNQKVRGADPRGEKGPRMPSPRQREVLQLLVEGRPMKEAADIMNVAPRTNRLSQVQDDGGSSFENHGRVNPIRPQAQNSLWLAPLAARDVKLVVLTVAVF